MVMPTDGIKISQLTAATASTSTDEFPVSQSGTTKKINPALLSTDWKALPVLPNAVTYLGDQLYQVVFPSVDYSNLIGSMTRLRFTNTVAASTQSANLNGTTQYFNRTSSITGITFTDDCVVGGWVKPDKHQDMCVFSRYNGTSGWTLRVLSNGVVQLVGFNAGSGNFSFVESIQSIPLNKWTYIAAQLDMSAFTATTTTSYVTINGADVAARVGRAGSNPTSLSQAGDLQIGRENTVFYFSGKLSQIFVSSAKITQANIRTLYSQGLTAALIASNNIASAYSLSNSLTDLNTTNANNLTAQGSATTTNNDAPWGNQLNGTISSTINFGVAESISVATDTTITARVAEGSTIPTSGGVSAVDISSAGQPVGMPLDITSPTRRLLYIPVTSGQSTASTSIVQFLPVTNRQFTVPQGVRMLKFGFFNTSFSNASNTFVMKFYNGAVNVVANELVQINQTTANSAMSLSAPVPVVPGEVINLNVGWLTVSGTANWSGGAAGTRQAPAIWVECA